MSDHNEDFDDLLTRLTDGIQESGKKIVFLFGAALTSYENGVEGVADITQRVVEILKKKPRYAERIEKLRQERGGDEISDADYYQEVIRMLNKGWGPDRFKRIVQAAILSAYNGRVTYDPNQIRDEDCEACEQDLDSWNIHPSLDALAHLIRDLPDRFHPLVLTTNFDPLIEIALRKAGLRVVSFSAERDGFSRQSDAQGVIVYHLHGSWRGTRMLSTGGELARDRKSVKRELADLMREHWIVTMAYSGWNDIFMKELLPMIRHELGQESNVVWTTYGGRLPETLPDDVRTLIEEDGVFHGIDCRDFLPALRQEWEELRPPPGPASGRGNQIFARALGDRLSVSALPINLNVHWGLERSGFVGSLTGGDTEELHTMLAGVEEMLAEVMAGLDETWPSMPTRKWQRLDLSDLGPTTANLDRLPTPSGQPESSRGVLLSIRGDTLRDRGGATAARDILRRFLKEFFGSKPDLSTGDAVVLHLPEGDVAFLAEAIAKEWQQDNPSICFQQFVRVENHPMLMRSPVLADLPQVDWAGRQRLDLAQMVAACLEKENAVPGEDRNHIAVLERLQERLRQTPTDSGLQDSEPPIGQDPVDADPAAGLVVEMCRWCQSDSGQALKELKPVLEVFYRHWPNAARQVARTAGRLATERVHFHLLGAIADNPDLVANWLMGFHRQDRAVLEPAQVVHRAISRRSPRDAVRIALIQITNLSPEIPLVQWAKEQLPRWRDDADHPAGGSLHGVWNPLIDKVISPGTQDLRWLRGDKATCENAWLTGLLHPGLLTDLCRQGVEREHVWWFCALFDVTAPLLKTLFAPGPNQEQTRAVFGLLTPEERRNLIADAYLADRITACRRGRPLLESQPPLSDGAVS